MTAAEYVKSCHTWEFVTVQGGEVPYIPAEPLQVMLNNCLAGDLERDGIICRLRDLLPEITPLGELEALMIRREASVRALASGSRAQLERYAGQVAEMRGEHARKGATWAAGGTLLSGLGQAGVQFGALL